MTGPVFVDADVFLYARDERDPAKLPRARAWLDHLWREGRGRTSVQVLSEYYVNLRRKDFSSRGPQSLPSCGGGTAGRILGGRPCKNPASTARQAAADCCGLSAYLTAI